MPNIYGNLIGSNNDPNSPLDGWGSLTANKGKYWCNIQTGDQFYHNGIEWIEYETINGIISSRNGINLIDQNNNIIRIENKEGQILINNEPVLDNIASLQARVDNLEQIINNLVPP